MVDERDLDFDDDYIKDNNSSSSNDVRLRLSGDNGSALCNDDDETKKNQKKNCESRDILLSADERYDIWEVKRLERPYLLLLPAQDLTSNDGNHHDDVEESLKYDNDEAEQQEQEEDEVLPLVDGCDIPNWHRQRFVKYSSYHQGILNVGSGCTLLRKESQLPMIHLSSSSSRCCRRRDTDDSKNSGYGSNGCCVAAGVADQQWKTLQLKLMTLSQPSRIVRIPFTNQDLSSQSEFNEVSPWFERENTPVLFESQYTNHWKARTSCTWDALVTRFGHNQWRFSDTHGGTMSLFTYNKYIQNIEGILDDAPLAVYDSQFGEQQEDNDDDENKDNRCAILNDYAVFPCFNGPDLFGICSIESDGEEEANNDEDGDDETDDEASDVNDDDEDQSYHRPPYRWILMGPERSGTGLHIDPMGTHAWVTLIEGMKLWVLFPYGTNPKDIGYKINTETGIQIPSVIWFRDYYETAISNVPNCIEVIQYPGETVYVPAGWPHLVLNLQKSVAITHNYATEYPSLSRIVTSVQSEEPDFYECWKNKLMSIQPDLYNRIIDLEKGLQQEEEKSEKF